MEEQLISEKTAKLAKEKGFDLGVRNHYKGDELINNGTKYNFNNIEEQKLWNIELTSAPTQSLLQRWLREKHNIHINIRYEEYFSHSQYKYFHFDVNNGSMTDVTGQEDLHEDIFDMCSQDIIGNHLNNDKYSIMIFEKKFAFKTYEEALEDALFKSLKLIN